jgi:hypothetical protein
MHFISSSGRRRGMRHARLVGGVAAVALGLSVGAARADATWRSVPDWRGCACRGAVVSVVPVASFSAPSWLSP